MNFNSKAEAVAASLFSILVIILVALAVVALTENPFTEKPQEQTVPEYTTEILSELDSIQKLSTDILWDVEKLNR